jgi:hypothetical protein
MVFIFPGAALAAAGPQIPTETAAAQLAREGYQPIQVSTPAMNGPGAFYSVANYIRRVSRGQPIGLVGFSAGGALALHLAQQPGINARSVLDFYGPPDLKDWLAYHGHDYYYQYVTSRVHLTPQVVRLLSGPTTSSAHFVAAFGLRDPNIAPAMSTASFRRDFPHGDVFYYPGPHGVTLYSDYAAFQNFVKYL